MLTVFVLVAVLLSEDGKIDIEAFQYGSAEECRLGASTFQDFLKTHDVNVVSGTWGCTRWDLVAPEPKPLAPKSDS